MNISKNVDFKITIVVELEVIYSNYYLAASDDDYIDPEVRKVLTPKDLTDWRRFLKSVVDVIKSEGIVIEKEEKRRVKLHDTSMYLLVHKNTIDGQINGVIQSFLRVSDHSQSNNSRKTIKYKADRVGKPFQIARGETPHKVNVVRITINRKFANTYSESLIKLKQELRDKVK